MISGVRVRKMGNIHENLSQSILRIRSEHREKTELLRSRVSLLTGKDRLLMTMYLDNSNSYRQMSRLAGVKDTSIARRIEKIIKRMIDGKYVICLQNRDKLTATEMAVAKEYFLLGWSIKKIATRRHWTFYRTRQAIKKIRQIIKDNKNEEEE